VVQFQVGGRLMCLLKESSGSRQAVDSFNIFLDDEVDPILQRAMCYYLDADSNIYRYYLIWENVRALLDFLIDIPMNPLSRSYCWSLCFRGLPPEKSVKSTTPTPRYIS